MYQKLLMQAKNYTIYIYYPNHQISQIKLTSSKQFFLRINQSNLNLQLFQIILIMQKNQSLPQKHSFLSSFQEYLQFQFNTIQSKFQEVNTKIRLFDELHLKNGQSITYLQNCNELLSRQIKGICNQNVINAFDRENLIQKQQQEIKDQMQMQFPILKPKVIDFEEQVTNQNKELTSYQKFSFNKVQQNSLKLPLKVKQFQIPNNNTQKYNLKQTETILENEDKQFQQIQKRLKSSIENFMQNRFSQIQNKLKSFEKSSTEVLTQDPSIQIMILGRQINQNIKNQINPQQSNKIILEKAFQINLQQVKQKSPVQNNKINIQQSFDPIIKNQFDLLQKKLIQLQYSFNRMQNQVHSQLQKAKEPIQKYELQVQFLRNSLQEYKLKKQAKFLKLMTGQSNSNSIKVNRSEIRNNSIQERQITEKNQIKSNSQHPKDIIHNNNTQQQDSTGSVKQYLEYLSQKVHFLTLTNKELLRKQVYDRQIKTIKESLYYIRKRISDKVSYQDLNQIESIEEFQLLKKPQTTEVSLEQGDNSSDHLQGRTQVQIQQTPQLQLCQINNQGDPETVLKSQVIQQETIPETQVLKRLDYNFEKILKIQVTLLNQQDFLKQMNKFYNQKLNGLQLSLEKLQQYKIRHQRSVQFLDQFSNEKYKTELNESLRNIGSEGLQAGKYTSNSVQYNVKHHLNQKMFSLSIQEDQNHIKTKIDKKDSSIRNAFSNSIIDQQKKLRNPQNYNFELNNVNKKISKLYGKQQAVQKNFKIFKQDVIKEIRQIRKTQYDKTDWESFKKAIKYFDEKIKLLDNTLKIIVLTLQEQGTLNDQKGTQSKSPQVAAKKKWSCLFCDKEIKNYEGKVSQIKYLGISQNYKYESPRAGGYYHKSLKDKQYDKIYIDQKIGNQSIHRSLVKKRKSSIGKPLEINSLEKSNELLMNLNQQQGFYFKNLNDGEIIGNQ